MPWRRLVLRRCSGSWTPTLRPAVLAIIATGIYAVLLRVPSLSALVETPYGRALTMKLGLLLFLLAAGGINLIGRGKGPFGRMVRLELVLATGIFVAAGFLTSVPPADDVWGVAPTNGDEIGELVLEPVNDSGVEGTATFGEITDGVEARLNLSGASEPGAVYLADIHRGTCYADGREDAGGTQDGFATAPERIERPLSPVHSGPDGEGASTTYLFGATFDGLFSGRKPLHVHVAGEEGTPELSCSDLSETQKATWNES